ncbi:hypothetical protein AVEN_181771-1 [Araneus ventricosus]|uniref:Uncharacterized protein n=1 Tax=Araneus ventricosus TaxID=182803 RepID=A0A4Y2SNA7_ARAVE|nr:hypothetical protein AVEN_181771-1 [Araneus ventricosus]
MTTTSCLAPRSPDFRTTLSSSQSLWITSLWMGQWTWIVGRAPAVMDIWPLRGLIRVLSIEAIEGRAPSVRGLGEGEKPGPESDELVESCCCLIRFLLSVRKDISLAIFIVDTLFKNSALETEIIPSILFSYCRMRLSISTRIPSEEQVTDLVSRSECPDKFFARNEIPDNFS